MIVHIAAVEMEMTRMMTEEEVGGVELIAMTLLKLLLIIKRLVVERGNVQIR